MENIITSMIGLITSVVMLVFSIWYIKVNVEINKARQKRIDDLKVYLDEFKTNTKFQFNKIIDSAKEAEKNLEAVSKGAQYVFIDKKKGEIEFDDYSELPFPKKINDMLLELHTHGDSIEEEEIVYREQDVIKLLLVIQNKKK
jgi:hypothetical protein